MANVSNYTTTEKFSAAQLANLRGKNILAWYVKNFPNDKLGTEIKPQHDFLALFFALYSKDVKETAYDVIGVVDSVVRERVFEKLSKLLDVSYCIIYDMWVNKDDEEITYPNPPKAIKIA